MPQRQGNIDRDTPSFPSVALRMRFYKTVHCIADAAAKNEIIKIAVKLGRAPLAPVVPAPL